MTTVNAASTKASIPRAILAHSWRLGLGLLLGFLGFGLVYEEYSPGNPADVDAVGLVIGLDILCGLAAFVLYPFRHRFPVPVVAALVLLSIPSAFAAGITMMGVVSLATRRKAWEIAVTSALFVGSMLVGERLAATVLIPVGEALAWWETTITALVLLTVMVLGGMYIGGRRQLAAAQREQMHSAQREREAQIHAAKADERTRIAREMHDVLAHRLSLVALHSGALEYRSDLSPEETRQTAGVIRENSHLALGELREVLGMLRDPNTLREDESARPQPTLDQLEQILADSRAAGTAVNLELEPDTRERLDALPQGTGRHLYRIIQEVLTNARRHAPRQEVRLLVGGGGGERLFLRASNRLDVGPREAPGPGSPPGSGLGLTGLAERVRLAGGEVQIEPEEQGEFVLKVWLPWGT
ncbi:sensor histidine kinase [Paeniglutamicibacter psychrophenolicus]|uniref:sensor histidine kinase n=1 Tax=Paeniglutamicibacter psychrophenolicus TaxID=257454 RepID=UPI0027855334|nr:histidine kinase [Paeniglutamicibacter psychrophenolicus]MDQ0092790.1 signal transduction histidine kinase [Paeniglutamicibacter psychrophenolicus]